jgi:hypothetical protein
LNACRSPQRLFGGNRKRSSLERAPVCAAWPLVVIKDKWLGDVKVT